MFFLRMNVDLLHLSKFSSLKMWKMHFIAIIFCQFKAFVSTLKEKQETRVGIVDLHPDIFRVSPRIDILHQ